MQRSIGVLAGVERAATVAPTSGADAFKMVEVYHAQTEPLIGYYDGLGLLRRRRLQVDDRVLVVLTAVPFLGFRIERVLPSPFDAKPQYRVILGDHLWQWLYLPIMHAVEFMARFAGRIQQGRISIYLIYSFVTLLALLMFIR